MNFSTIYFPSSSFRIHYTRDYKSTQLFVHEYTHIIYTYIHAGDTPLKCLKRERMAKEKKKIYSTPRAAYRLCVAVATEGVAQRAMSHSTVF